MAESAVAKRSQAQAEAFDTSAVRAEGQVSLNKLLKAVLEKGSRLSTLSYEVLADYDQLYREAHSLLTSERVASNGSMDGLEEFYNLVNILRRNRDVAASIQRGLKNIRPLGGFKFVEEDTEKPQQQKKKGRPKGSVNKPKNPDSGGQAAPIFDMPPESADGSVKNG
jgi:hypothetical protein